MITLHSITATNIRSLGHAVFEPLVDGGMTALNGPNGAGKSSLLVAMLWALYGVTPKGVQQAAMRRQGSEGVCSVVVEFEFNNQMVKVERGLKGRKDAPYMLVHLAGREQAKTPSTGTAWMLRLFGGLDAEGFMTAFVIRQKELDGLVKAAPSERRKLIERLAGIDRMSTAVKSAREEESEVKKRLELLPGDPEAVREAREVLEAAQQHAVAAWDAYEETETAADAAVVDFTAAEAAATDMQQRLDAHTMAERAVVTAHHDLTMAQERTDAARRDIDQTSAAATGGSDADVTAAQTAHAQAQAALQSNQQAREGADRAVEAARVDAARAAQATERNNRGQAAVEQTRAAASVAAERAAQYPTDLDERAAAAEGNLSALNERVGALRGEYARLDNSIKAMEATDDSCCPTCATALSDPSVVLDALRRTQAQVKADGVSAGNDAKDLEANVQTLRTQATQATAAHTEARHLSEQAATTETAAREAHTASEEATETARRSTQVADNAKAAALSAAEQTTALSRAVDEAANVLRTAQVAAAALARLPQAEQAMQTAATALSLAQGAHQSATTTEAACRVNPADKDTIFERYRTTQAIQAATERTKVEAHGNFRVADEQTKTAERVRDAEELRMRARAEAHVLLEQKTAVREALDFFRKDRIASLAPELSEIATDQIAKMTDGKFTAVELDEEFTPVITDANGLQRPASWLSGGEESAVALALRLAIGEVIAGTQGGLLWMDEPQTAMDAQRRPAMMSVIRDLPGRQPILISHVSEAADMVDLVLEVLPDEENGSTVARVSATGGATDPAMLDAISA